MIVLSLPGEYIYRLIAIQSKTKKIHIKHITGLSMCSRRFDIVSDLTVDEIDDYKTFLGILDDQNICKICKKDLLTMIEHGHKFYFHQEVNIL